MPGFNGQQISSLNITPAGGTAADIAGDVLSVELEVSPEYADVTSVTDTGKRREYLMQDWTMTLTCRKATDSGGAFAELHPLAESGATFGVDMNYATTYASGGWSGNAVVQSLSAPYGADGNQAFTASLQCSGGAAGSFG